MTDKACEWCQRPIQRLMAHRKKYCRRECRDMSYQAKRAASFNAQGLCTCGKEPLSSRTMGELCLRKLRLRAIHQRGRARGYAAPVIKAPPKLKPSRPKWKPSPAMTLDLVTPETVAEGYTWPELIAIELERLERVGATTHG